MRPPPPSPTAPAVCHQAALWQGCAGCPSIRVSISVVTKGHTQRVSRRQPGPGPTRLQGPLAGALPQIPHVTSRYRLSAPSPNRSDPPGPDLPSTATAKGRGGASPHTAMPTPGSAAAVDERGQRSQPPVGATKTPHLRRRRRRPSHPEKGPNGPPASQPATSPPAHTPSPPSSFSHPRAPGADTLPRSQTS